MYRVIDNESGKILAVCFSTELAIDILKLFTDETLDDGRYRFAYEICDDEHSIKQTIKDILDQATSKDIGPNNTEDTEIKRAIQMIVSRIDKLEAKINYRNQNDYDYLRRVTLPKVDQVVTDRVRTRDLKKIICQLRRADNNKWLWSSRAYTNPELSLRDAKETAFNFGWEIVNSKDSSRLVLNDLDDDDDK